MSMARVARLEQVLDRGFFSGSVPVSGASWYEVDELAPSDEGQGMEAP